MAKKMALGKGIASLIKETPSEVVNEAIEKNNQVNKEKEKMNIESTYMVDINQIKANPAQPRKIFKEKHLEELAESIKENGVIQPLIVSKNDDGTFELIAGERRLRASKKANLSMVPVVIKRGTDKEKMIMSIIENVQRSDLNCVEEALAYYQLMDDYKLTQEEVAKKLGKERSSIANYLRILKLPREVIELLQKEVFSFGHGKVLSAIKDRDHAIRMAHECVNNQYSIRELEKQIKKSSRSVKAKDSNVFFDEKLDQLKQKLEQKTGFHYDIKSKSNGKGEILIKYSNEAEFNDIFDHLIK